MGQYGSRPLHQPSFDDMLKQALHPYQLKDAHTYNQHLQVFIQGSQLNKDPKTLQKQFLPKLQKMAEFFRKLESLSTKEQRDQWVRNTYKAPQIDAASAPSGPVQVENDRLKKNLQECEDKAQEKESEKDLIITSLQTANDDWEKRVIERDKEIQDLEDNLSKISLIQTENDNLKKELRRSNEHVIKKEEELQHLKGGMPEEKRFRDQCQQLQRQLEDYKTQNRALNQHISSLTDRLSEEMNTKLSKDEGALENIGIKNRPIKIAEEYELFQSNIWLSAKENLDRANIPNIKAIKILAETLKEAEYEAFCRHQEVIAAMYRAISLQEQTGARPIDFTKIDRKSKCDTVIVKQIPDGVKNGIGDFLRIRADTADISIIVETILTKLKPKVDEFIRKNSRGVRSCEKFCTEYLGLKDYVTECARLSWKMALQRPPMSFDNETGLKKKWRGEKYQTVSYGSDDPTKEGNVVQFYVYPALKHGDGLMAKGTVFVAAAQ